MDRLRHWFCYHVNQLGWSDIGYHFLIDANGVVYEGRCLLGDEPVLGAHALHNNDRALGIALMGNFSAQLPTTAAWCSLEQLVTWQCQRFGIDPMAEMGWTFVNEDLRCKKIKRPTIVAHSDIRTTACPGEPIAAKLAELRQRVAQAL